MSTTVHRAMLTAAGAAMLAWAPAPALAQVDRDIVMNIMLECAKIGDPTARLACYDNNIRSAGASVAAAVPGRGPVPQGGGAPVASGGTAGFGLNTARPQQSAAPRQNFRPQQGFGAPASQGRRITPTVAAVATRGPGAYLVTLEDGAQWEFAEDMPLSYRPPERGSTVEIERGTFGSYLLRFDQQQPVRVRRVP